MRESIYIYTLFYSVLFYSFYILFCSILFYLREGEIEREREFFVCLFFRNWLTKAGEDGVTCSSSIARQEKNGQIPSLFTFCSTQAKQILEDTRQLGRTIYFTDSKSNLK